MNEKVIAIFDKPSSCSACPFAKQTPDSEVQCSLCGYSFDRDYSCLCVSSYCPLTSVDKFLEKVKSALERGHVK